MRIALDTNRLTDLLRGDLELAAFVETCEEVWFPLVVIAEIKAGFLGGTRPHKNENLLQRLLAKPAFGVLLPRRETADVYARLYVQLKRAGKPVPDNDLWIAAMAIENNLTLVTRDAHFKRIPQLLQS